MISKNIFAISVISLLVFTSGQMALGYGGPPEQTSANNYTVDIQSDQESYTLGNSVIFSGTVNKYDEDRTLRITIFGSGNSLIVTQKTPVDSDRNFSHEVPLNEKFSEGKFTVKGSIWKFKSNNCNHLL